MPFIDDKKSFQGLSDKSLVFILCVLTFLLFLTISITRHFSLLSEGYDLGIFDQAIWNVTQGNSLVSSIKFIHGGSLLGDHFEPILFFIAPLYRAWSNVIVLFILQSLLLASAVIPLYLIARTVLKDRLVIFAFLICYILSKPLRGIAFFDFYPDSFIVPALFWAYYSLIKRNNALLWVSVITLLLCKEDTTFLVFGLGLFTLITQKRKWLGSSFLIISGFLWWLETAILIPYFSPTHHYDYLSKLPFGATYFDNLKFCIFHPISFIKFILIKPKIEYILRLLGPLCFLSLLSPAHFILIFFPVFKNLLAAPDNNIFYTINSHYAAGIIPFVFIAAIYGCHGVLQNVKVKNANVAVSSLLIGFTILFGGRTDGARFAGLVNNMRVNHTLEKIRSLGLIPPDASVIATNNLCPHLSHRKYLYLWDPKGDQKIFPQYIAIDKLVLGDQFLSSKENLIIDSYLKTAMGRGYKIISTVQNNNFMILASPQDRDEKEGRNS